MAIAVTSREDMEKKLAEAGEKLVVIDFFATWCGPCKMIAPVLEEMAKSKADKLVILKVDVDLLEELAAEYSISVMPTFVFKKKGAHLDTLVGSNQNQLMQLVEKHLMA